MVALAVEARFTRRPPPLPPEPPCIRLLATVDEKRLKVLPIEMMPPPLAANIVLPAMFETTVSPRPVKVEPDVNIIPPPPK
jgi:hypothetical protein